MTRKKPRKPKRPKASASLATWQRYDDRMKDWQKRVKEWENEPKKKDAIRRKWR